MSGLGNKEIFARNLQRYMDERGLSRIELSQAIDVPYSTLSEWLTAKKYPRIDKIEKLAFAFGIEKSDLIEDKPMLDENYYHDPEAAALADMIKDNPRYRVLFEASRNLSADDVNFVIDMIKKLSKTDEDFIE